MFAASITALLLAAVLVSGVLAAPNDGPPLVTGSKAGPVTIGGGRNVPDTLVAKLDVGSGEWVAWAKVQIITEEPGSTADNTAVSCRLVSGASSSKVSATFGFSGTADFVSHAMELSLARAVRSGGQFRLYCRSSNGHPGTEARFIRLDAVKVDQLVRVDLDTGSTATIGSGDVKAITGEADDPVTLGVASAHGKTTVATMELTPGNWWIRSEMAVHAPSNDVSCAMSVSGSTDNVTVRAEGALSTVMDLTSHVSRGDPHILAIKCGTNVEQGAPPAVVDQVRVTAFRVARLVQHNLGAGTNQSFGTGAPEARSSFANTAYVEVSPTAWSTVGSLGLNANEWLAFGRVGRPVGTPSDDGTVFPDDIQCELFRSPTASDRAATIATTAQQMPVNPLIAYVAVSGRGGATLVLRCRTPSDPESDPPYVGRLTRIRLTALRVGSVDIQDI
jgi:hypothetical protein